MREGDEGEAVIVGVQEQGWGWKDCGERFWKHFECRREGGIVLCICLKEQSPHPQPGLHRILSLERILQGHLAHSPASGTTGLTQTTGGSWLLLDVSRNNDSISHCRYLSENKCVTSS